MSKGRGPLARLWSVLRIVVALGILVWVGKNLPWRDELVFGIAGAEELRLTGTIEGDWKEDPVRFVPDDPAALDERWPLGAREAVARGAPILGKRRANGDPSGFDWHPGMPHAFAEMDVLWLALAQVCFFVANLTIVSRWWRLLALAGCPTRWWTALRLTFLGLFFNNVLPGATGGDVPKGLMIAKQNPGRGADALVTVLVDRIFGMVALAVLALVVILIVPGPFDALRPGLLIGLALVVVGTLLYAQKGLRRALGLSALVDRLPMGEKLRQLDRAALLYLKRPGGIAVAFGFSFVNHVLVTLGAVSLGRSLGVHGVELVDYFVVVPVGNLISAVPLAPGGWGIGEFAYGALFGMINASAALGVAVSVTFRLSQLAQSLLGGLFLLLPKSRDEMRAG
ncbi:MAG: lysylphosphatidylglycerol synthase transmembrane domain-containing protein [Planctomycetota bacterium]